MILLILWLLVIKIFHQIFYIQEWMVLAIHESLAIFASAPFSESQKWGSCLFLAESVGPLVLKIP